MIFPIIGIHQSMTSEYAWILAEMRRLGLTPSGDINIDRAKVQRAREKESENNKNISEKFELPNSKHNDSEERENLEYERIGAMNVAMINRVLLQI